MAVWEVVQLAVHEGGNDKFESVFRSYLPALKEVDGCLDVKLLRAVDKEHTFLLLILWESIEHHTELFVKSETFTAFAGDTAPFYTAPPVLFHATTVIDGFGEES